MYLSTNRFIERSTYGSENNSIYGGIASANFCIDVWDALLRYASTVPATSFDEKFREEFLRAEYGFRMDLEYTMYRVSRALELLKNYIEFGVVTGFSKKGLHEFINGYRPLMTAFADGEARRGLAEGSMKSLWSRLYRLHLFFIDKGADTFDTVPVI